MLKAWLQAKINVTAKIITLSLKNRTMYNSKGGCMAAKFGVRGSVQVARSGMSNSSNFVKDSWKYFITIFFFGKYSHWFWSLIQGSHSCWQLVMISQKFLVYHFPWEQLTPGLSKHLISKTHFLVFFRTSLTWCCLSDFKYWTDDFILCRSNNS